MSCSYEHGDESLASIGGGVFLIGLLAFQERIWCRELDVFGYYFRNLVSVK
jgi:hypothetical protein